MKKNGNGNGGSALALAGNEALATIDFDNLGTDGMEEVGAEDVKIARKVFNAKTIDASGEPVAVNMWFDTITEETKRELDLALLTLTKRNTWSEYDEVEGRTNVRCESLDQVTGTMDNGRQRPCQGCPDAQWQTDENGRRKRRCGPVYAVLAVERDTQQPCLLTFKKTSLPVIQTHLNKHHIGRMTRNGKRANVPLFAYQVTAKLKMSDDKKYAIPVLERGDVLPPEEIKAHAETAKAFREFRLEQIRNIVSQDATERAPVVADNARNVYQTYDHAATGTDDIPF